MPGVVLHVCNCNTQATEAGGPLQAQGNSLVFLYNKVQRVRHCLKINNKENKLA